MQQHPGTSLGVLDGEYPFADEVRSHAPFRYLPIPNVDVTASALYALGHIWERADLRAWLGWQTMRRSIFVALSRTPVAVERDKLVSIETEIRNCLVSGCRLPGNWATFALGVLSELDLRPFARLSRHASRAVNEVRGEAICGLPKRQDERALNAILASPRLLSEPLRGCRVQHPKDGEHPAGCDSVSDTPESALVIVVV